MPTARHMCWADTLLLHICAIHTRLIWYLAQVLAQPYHRIHGQRRYHCDLFVVWQCAGLLCLLPGFTVMSFLLWLSPHGFSQLLGRPMGPGCCFCDMQAFGRCDARRLCCLHAVVAWLRV